MTFLEWTASIVDSLAWPGTLLLAALLLKQPLSQVILTVSKIKYGKLEVDLSKEVKEIEEAAKTIDAEEVKVIEERRKARMELELTENVSTPDWVSRALEAASVSPESAILLSWKELEREINLAAHRLGMAQASRTSITPIRCLQFLIDSGRLSKDDQRLIMKMRRLRNEVAHTGHRETNLTEENVLSFMSQCEYMIERISKVK